MIMTITKHTHIISKCSKPKWLRLHGDYVLDTETFIETSPRKGIPLAMMLLRKLPYS